MSRVPWMHRMQQRSTELDRFCPPLPAPDMMQHGRRAPLLPCNGCSRYQAALNTPQLMWKCCWAQYSLLKEKINTFYIALPVVAGSWCPLSTVALINMPKLQEPLNCNRPTSHSAARFAWECMGGLKEEVSCQRKKIPWRQTSQKRNISTQAEQIAGHPQQDAGGSCSWNTTLEKGTRGLIETPEDWIQRT